VFVITVEQMTTENINGETHTQIKVGKLNLVDLAGSERIRITGATGQQLEESKKINKSLSCLGNVINALTDQKGRIHIPYRDSKLTRLLEDSLGGNCKTTMIAMISPAHESFNESLSSLHFAQRAKRIKNRPIINEDVNNRALIRQYEKELRNLRQELEEKNRMIQSNQLVMQLQEEKEQAEQDRNEAIRELEKASRNYLIEREEKMKLEKKIQMMNSQMITGGHKIEETPQFKSALKNQLKVYEGKLQEIERERQQIEEDKAETEKYKSLLFKQRDIMNALATKLNERDEIISQLQEELDACEKQDEINEKLNKRVMQLESLLRKYKIQIPPPQYSIHNNFK
jgi:kinesin family protein 3/17